MRVETAPLANGAAHLAELQAALPTLYDELERVERWAAQLATVLPARGRLLAAGNGGSAAQAQHLTAELVGRYRDDRPAFSAVALHADTSSLTAIVNDYGGADLFSRQVAAHGRPGDVLVCLSTSGRSENLLAAADVGRRGGLTTWALTGPAPNPLAQCCDEALVVPVRATATVQELHLVVLHLLCAALDVALGVSESA